MDLIQYDLETTDSAAKRTRGTIVVLVVACVLGGVAFLNTSRWGWIHQRIETLANNEGYVAHKLGYIANTTDPIPVEHQEAVEHAKRQFADQLIRSYVETAFVIRVPFFGVAFDVNDLGLLGGLGLAVILTLLSYSLRSEVICLEIGFEHAREKRKLWEFYELLASRQVFTMPKVREEGHVVSRHPLLIHTPRVILFFPVVVYLAILVNDLSTTSVGKAISSVHTSLLLIYTVFFQAIIMVLSFYCWRLWRRIDDIWEYYWDVLNPAPAEAHRSGADPGLVPPWVRTRIDATVRSVIGPDGRSEPMAPLPLAERPAEGTHGEAGGGVPGAED